MVQVNKIENKVRSGKRILFVPTEIILRNPSQPRKVFERDELYNLADSIKMNGILQPITVRRLDDGRFELVTGERRLRAARIAGMHEVPCVEIAITEKMSAVLALLENIQRQDLNFFEEAEGIYKLIEEWEITQEEAAKKIGKTQSTVANKLRLLRLPRLERDKIVNSGLSERHARALLKLADDKQLGQAIDYIVEKKLNVSQTEMFVENLLSKENKGRKIIAKSCDVRLFFNTINKAIDVMRQSGVDAVAEKEEKEEFTVYTIKIPKSKDKNIA